MSIIGNANAGRINQHAANQLAMAARGESCARLFLAECKGQGDSLKRFLGDVVEMDQEGRKAFRVTLNAQLKSYRKEVNEGKDTPEKPYLQASARSAGTRISEATTFSRAIDAGYSPDFDGFTYHQMIGMSRTFLQSESATGPTQRRGRPATPILDKVKAFLNKLEPTTEQYKEIHTLVMTMGKIKEVK